MINCSRTKVGQKKIVPKLEQKVQNEVHEFLTETHLDNPHIRNRKLSLGMVQYIQKPSRQKEEQGSYNRTKDESGKDGYSSHHSK